MLDTEEVSRLQLESLVYSSRVYFALLNVGRKMSRVLDRTRAYSTGSFSSSLCCCEICVVVYVGRGVCCSVYSSVGSGVGNDVGNGVSSDGSRGVGCSISNWPPTFYIEWNAWGKSGNMSRRLVVDQRIRRTQSSSTHKDWQSEI